MTIEVVVTEVRGEGYQKEASLVLEGYGCLVVAEHEVGVVLEESNHRVGAV